MTAEEAFYTRALHRIDRSALVLAALFVAGVAVRRGWRDAAGCAIGAVLSFINLKLWKRLVNSTGSPGRSPASAVLLGLRYLLLGGVIFVIIKYFEVSLLAVLAGLFVTAAAVIVEIVYELIFASRNPWNTNSG